MRPSERELHRDQQLRGVEPTPQNCRRELRGNEAVIARQIAELASFPDRPTLDHDRWKQAVTAFPLPIPAGLSWLEPLQPKKKEDLVLRDDIPWVVPRNPSPEKRSLF